MGLASSVANLVFEKTTGKDFGDTVLAMIDGDGDSNPAITKTEVASAASGDMVGAPTGNSSKANAVLPILASADTDTGLSRRALFAYRKSMEISPWTADLRRAS